MAQTRIYLYGNCSSCKNAEQVLKETGVEYDRRDVFKDRLSAAEVNELLREIGKRPEEVLSRRSIPYRALGLGDRAVTDDELAELMSEHPGLLRRPIIIAPGEVQIGFNRTALESLARQHAGIR
jgi:Spx/MgsR family transcriptional regulator